MCVDGLMNAGPLVLGIIDHHRTETQAKREEGDQ